MGSNWKPPDQSATKYTQRLQTQTGYAILKLNEGENEIVSTDNRHKAGGGGFCLQFDAQVHIPNHTASRSTFIFITLIYTT